MQSEAEIRQLPLPDLNGQSAIMCTSHIGVVRPVVADLMLVTFGMLMQWRTGIFITKLLEFLGNIEIWEMF